MKNIATIALSLFLVCFIAVGALAAVEFLTREQIADNGRMEIQRALSALIPDAEYVDISDTAGLSEFNAGGEFENTEILQVFKAYDDGEVLGHVVILSTQGYIDAIGLRVGILADGTVSGVVIGENSETPGLGANIAKEDFLSQFVNGRAPFGVDVIDKVTSATYSSKYVLRGVNAACSFAERLGGEGE